MGISCANQLIIPIDPHADRSFLQTIGLAMFAKCTGAQPIIDQIDGKHDPLNIALRRNIPGNFGRTRW